MSTNLFKKTDQAESIYKTVEMERKNKSVLCLFCFFMMYPNLNLRMSGRRAKPACRALCPLLWKWNSHKCTLLCFLLSSERPVPVTMRFRSFPSRIISKESSKRRVEAEEDQKLWYRYVLFSLFFLFGGVRGEGGGEGGGNMAESECILLVGLSSLAARPVGRGLRSTCLVRKAEDPEHLLSRETFRHPHEILPCHWLTKGTAHWRERSQLTTRQDKHVCGSPNLQERRCWNVYP